MDKYCDIEKTYKTSVDNWLCNLYFSITMRKSSFDPKAATLILDEDTKQIHSKYIEEEEKEMKTTVLKSKKSATTTPAISNDIQYSMLYF